MAQDDHVTVQEAAEYLRISVSTVYRLLRTGKLTGVKVKADGEKGGLRVSRKLVFEFSDGQPKAASLERTAPRSVEAVSTNGKPDAVPQREKASQFERIGMEPASEAFDFGAALKG